MDKEEAGIVACLRFVFRLRVGFVGQACANYLRYERFGRGPNFVRFTDSEEEGAVATD